MLLELFDNVDVICIPHVLMNMPIHECDHFTEVRGGFRRLPHPCGIFLKIDVNPVYF